MRVALKKMLDSLREGLFLRKRQEVDGDGSQLPAGNRKVRRVFVQSERLTPLKEPAPLVPLSQAVAGITAFTARGPRHDLSDIASLLFRLSARPNSSPRNRNGSSTGSRFAAAGSACATANCAVPSEPQRDIDRAPRGWHCQAYILGSSALVGAAPAPSNIKAGRTQDGASTAQWPGGPRRSHRGRKNGRVADRTTLCRPTLSKVGVCQSPTVLR